ncbi:hypothetical protein [Sporosarcina sp. ITBMC105]
MIDSNEKMLVISYFLPDKSFRMNDSTNHDIGIIIFSMLSLGNRQLSVIDGRIA